MNTIYAHLTNAVKECNYRLFTHNGGTVVAVSPTAGQQWMVDLYTGTYDNTVRKNPVDLGAYKDITDAMMDHMHRHAA